MSNFEIIKFNDGSYDVDIKFNNLMCSECDFASSLIKALSKCNDSPCHILNFNFECNGNCKKNLVNLPE